jgi:hypothetical protein
MRSSLRHAILLILLVAFLAPGLVQARPLHDSSARLAAAGEVTHETGFLSLVWNLLTKLWAGSPLLEKDEVVLPPSSMSTTPPPPDDNGGRLDPLG